MGYKLRIVFTVLIIALLAAGNTGGAFASDTPKEKKDSRPAAKPKPLSLEALEETIADLQAQITALKAQVEKQQSQANAAVSAAPVTDNAIALGKLPTTAPIPPAATATPTSAAPQDVAPESPLQLKIGSASITPVGFMDLTNTFRSTNAGTSLQTNFGSIPYTNTPAGRLSEDKFSAANSRIGFRVDAKFRNTNILGYYEGDFVGGIGNGAFNTQVSSNSLLYRIRLYWINARIGKFEMLGGQSWSMLTPNRRQISPLPGDLFYSQVVDVNYMNGLTWGRIPGIRFLYHPTGKVTTGVALENAAQYFGGSGGGGVPTLPALLATPMASQLDQNTANGIAVPNVHPDIISKIAFDPNSRLHFEVAGVESTVKLFNPLTQQSFTKGGGGGSVNLNFEVVKNLRLVTNNFWSDGAGRYLFGVAPDFIVRADGSPSLIHSGSTVSGFEYQHDNTQFYSYYGGIYIKPNTTLDADGTTIRGYGFNGSPNSQNRTTQEGTFGLTQTVWRDARYGAMQLMFQYAYFFRNPFFVASGAPRNAHESAGWFNLRYVLPGAPPPTE